MRKRDSDLFDENTQDKSKKIEKKVNSERSRKAVILYTVALAVTVIFLVLLSYFVQQRNSEKIDILSEQSQSAQEKIENLQTGKLNDKAKIAEYEEIIADLEKKVSELQEENIKLREDWVESAKKQYDKQAEKYDELYEEYNKLLENIEAGD